MCVPFIRNHQYNLIKKQADSLLHALRTIADPKVLGSVRSSVESKIQELFPDAADSQRQLLQGVTVLETADDFQKYLKGLEAYLVEFPAVTPKQLQKLFPKNKKLKLPDLSNVDFRYVTYLSWYDIAVNKLFMVYSVNGQMIGIEGRITPTHKKGFCFLCNRHEELAMFSAISRKRTAHASPDYYKAIGNYLCLDSGKCNRNITNITALDTFIGHVLG
ncbi:FusB/FusC family EF-G-binding protein [Paenibacillus puerhi]|uniref:FusB/FusC family EF-G-binding protein n=1 Tax=Paenibacillus puerhi TaxID=2692622 RepID=UPI00135A10C2|nr:FusB/FusC family EF-G-binding protein [Paenibacillus puerhi]